MPRCGLAEGHYNPATTGRADLHGMQDLPQLTSIVMAAAGVMLIVGCLVSRLGVRAGVPVYFLFLLVGMLSGSDLLGGIAFERYDLAFIFGTLALVVILYDGGLNTRWHQARLVLAPAGVLATVGVVGVAGMTSLGARLVGLDWPTALLIGAIVSSTDAAAVFALFKGLRLQKRTGLTIELESGLNDPMAIMLATAATAFTIEGEAPGWLVVPGIIVQLLIGGVFGALIGWMGRWLFLTVQLSTAGLYPVFSLSVALVAFGIPSVLEGSGFLAAYVAGIVMGNGNLPYKGNLVKTHDAFAWLAQALMFLLLGLLVFPTHLPGVALQGLGLALFIALVARPVVVTLLLLPFGYAWREIAVIAWLGLRGAVPIIIATIPVLTAVGHPQAMEKAIEVFNLVFFVVVVSAIIPGTTVRGFTRWMKMQRPAPPDPVAAVDITSAMPLDAKLVDLRVEAGSPAAGRELRDLALPGSAVVMLLVRADHLMAPRGHTMIEAGDHVFIFCDPTDEHAVRGMFEAGNTGAGGPEAGAADAAPPSSAEPDAASSAQSTVSDAADSPEATGHSSDDDEAAGGQDDAPAGPPESEEDPRQEGREKHSDREGPAD